MVKRPTFLMFFNLSFGNLFTLQLAKPLVLILAQNFHPKLMKNTVVLSDSLKLLVILSPIKSLLAIPIRFFIDQLYDLLVIL